MNVSAMRKGEPFANVTDMKNFFAENLFPNIQDASKKETLVLKQLKIFIKVAFPV
jgi:hypothetical protein